MKKNKLKSSICLAACTLTLLGCSDKDSASSSGNGDNIITFNDFEAIDGWGAANPSVTKEKAHSGKYSIKVDSGTEYSLGFEKLLGQVTQKKPKKLKLEAWAYVPSKETGGATVVITLVKPNNNQQIVWEGIKMAEVEGFKEWVELKKEITLPENVDVTDRLQCYLWRQQATEPVYLDDVKISVVE